jgi:hypothetical protein
MDAMTDIAVPGEIRVSDVDRKTVEARLRVAHADGSITLDELDERLVLVWQSKTRRDLAALVADLPAPPLPPVLPPPKPRPPDVLRLVTTIWLCVNALNFMVWMLVSVSVGEFEYPWFFWSLVPPGVVLAAVRAARTR